jgi:hypothetical protein
MVYGCYIRTSAARPRFFLPQNGREAPWRHKRQWPDRPRRPLADNLWEGELVYSDATTSGLLSM